jgi:hypothetical protein
MPKIGDVFFSLFPARDVDPGCLSGVRARNLPGCFTAYDRIPLRPMLPGLQQWRRAYARSVICGSQGILSVSMWWAV